ncbi:heavy metal translocating P-type ATPase [Desulfobulbus sp. AH-315-M07]|nr:heavy metal translocating P-type ATPase [Desulfobulbus sp. AH-315-M07]
MIDTSATTGRAEEIAGERVFVVVASWVPGRMRLRATNGGAGSVMRAARHVATSPAPLAVEVRPWSNSIVIKYDSSRSDEEIRGSVETVLGVRFESLTQPTSGSEGDEAAGRLGNGESGKWTTRHRIPGRFRLHHPMIGRYQEAAQKVDLALMNLCGVTSYEVGRLTSNVVVVCDEEELTFEEVLEALDGALRELLERDEPLSPDDSRRGLILATTSMGLAIAAVSVPVLLPVAFFAVVATSVPIAKGAYLAIREEKKLKVDVLDATVIGCCLVFGHVFAGSLMVWVVAIADHMLEHSRQQSGKLLSQVFGRQVRKAWLVTDEGEISYMVDRLKPGDIIAVRTGEQIPVDGTIVSGDCAVDQQGLTGESAPVEKSDGDKAFAMTHLVAGKAHIRVEGTREHTQAARIVQILEESVTHKVRLQSQGERFADMMVLPTFGLSALGLVTGGPPAMMAILNADFGTGIRVAAPIALLASVSVAAKQGVIIKDASLLEHLHEMDAVVFDKTGTLTAEIPEVAQVRVNGRFSEEQVLGFAACAEGRFTHPIAKAILQKAEQMGIAVPEVDDKAMHVGFGVQVQLDDMTVKVGSRRYMDRESVRVPQALSDELEGIHREGRSAVFVAVDEHLAGLIELRASERPSASRVIEGLRKRNVSEILLISGDHEAATRSLARKLGITRYHAEVLPHQKAEFIERLQAEGHKVGMVGDGINDSVALSKANISFSMRGASDVAVDVADVIIMDGDLTKIETLFQISDTLRDNVRRSFALITLPNVLCIGGALFGAVGLGTSLLLNNGFNFAATINGMLPLSQVIVDSGEPIN